MQLSDFLNILEIVYSEYGYVVVFISNFVETSPLGWFVPGGILVALGGFYAYGGELSLAGVFISASLGMMATFYTAYFLGHKTGMKLAKRYKQEKMAKRAETLLDKHGATILTTSLLAGLTRFWISYVAGIKRYSFKQFTLYASIATITWNALLILAGYLAGAERELLETYIGQLGILAWILLFVAIGVIYWKIDTEFKGEVNENKIKKK